MNKSFVISVDESRFSRTLTELAPLGIKADLFRGVDGKNARLEAPELTGLCRKACTDKIIGVGIAHIRLAKHIVANETPGGVFLVLEDDVKAKYGAEETRYLIKTAVDQAPPGWDIITLFCQGNCHTSFNKELDRILHGSTAAYLLSWYGAQKLAKEKLVYHIDHQRNSLGYNTYKGPRVFDTYDPVTGNMVAGQSIQFWTKQDLVRVAGKDINMLQWLILMVCLCAGVIIFVMPFIPDLSWKLLLFVFAWHCTIPMFTSLEYLHYKCSSITHLFGILFPVAVIIIVRTSWYTVPILLMASMMLIFHILTALVELE